MSVWHNDDSNVLTLEKKTLKTCHVLEDLNYEILSIGRRVLEENPQKSLVGYRKNLVHQKISYIARLRYLENHTEAVDQ